LIALLDRPHSRDGDRAVAEQTFGARLKQLREEAGLTQQQLADLAEMNRFSVAKLEQDLYSPSWPTVQALAKALGTTCTAFEGTVEPDPESKPARPLGRPKKTPPEQAGDDEGEKPRKRGK
jgi:DNA-binding XRE family transcriptional regulator